jgi:DNA-3-methyladenine glycosylase I
MDYSSEQYREIFNLAIDTLRKLSVSMQLFDAHFLWYQNRNYKDLSDNDIYWILVYVPFYAGMRAATVSKRLPAIKEYFGDFRKVKNYTDSEIEQFKKDPRTIHHPLKINACIENAIKLDNLVKRFGSFKEYLAKFEPLTNESKIEELVNDLRKNIKFKYLKDRTLFHFLTDLGINVLKPDRVICRVFSRLGLIDDVNNLEQAISVGRKISETTSYPIRCVDIIFVKLGQMGEDTFFDGEPTFGINNGICFEKNPICSLCSLTKFCKYYLRSHS